MKSVGPKSRPRVRIVDATAEHWNRLERLFGPRGACAGCWCMWWRLAPKDWRAGKDGANRQELAQLVRSAAVPPGILALADEEAVGWCAVAPRADLPRLGRSRVLAPVDQAPVWSVICFFVAPSWRQAGLTARLLEGAIRFARRHGATIVEGYPIDIRGRRTAAAFLYTGVASTFGAAGFDEVARRSPSRPIMRRQVAGAG